ncbi:unnamed protein product [Adineta steineri]|uniref:Uncharacterized protein n=1 Tax=Adineta steineri TaxID=433720 RepID=A0A815DQJ9_9BILA|nr:unnamed protein product [Adineta steineri]CAF3805792.1 unnamed protein product [Adineta steineri]
MPFLSDIVFDQLIYPLATVLSLILYDMTGTHLAISLPNAKLMRFLHPFENTSDCEQHIERNDQKNITLFTYEDNMDWLIINSYFENIPQLQKINIFCSSIEDQDYWTDRTDCFRNKIKEPFLRDELDLQLLLFGRTHTHKVYKELYEKEGSVSNIVKEDANKILNALSIYFQNKINAEEQQIRPSEEAQT